MQLISFRHKGLKQLYAGGTARGVPAALADKLRKLLFALETADGLDQVSRFPGWKLHPLKGALKCFWSLTNAYEESPASGRSHPDRGH